MKYASMNYDSIVNDIIMKRHTKRNRTSLRQNPKKENWLDKIWCPNLLIFVNKKTYLHFKDG